MIPELSVWDWVFLAAVVASIHVLFLALAGRGARRKPGGHDSSGQ